MQKVLILYTNYGTGHYKAALAIKEYIENNYGSGIDVEVFDPLSFGRPYINKIFASTGKIFATKLRGLRGKFYKERMYQDYFKISWANDFCMKLFFTRKVKEKMLATRADVIISTQVGPTALVAKHRDLFNGKLISILTDYNIHRYFTSVHKNVDLYCVPTEDLRKKMIELGISEEKVKATGIPVGMKFANGGLINKKKVLKKLGIRNSGDKPVFLFVCGGGNGYANALGCFKKLVNSEIDFNFIFVAGKNGKLRKKAKDISGLCDKDGVCLGYVDYIDELLAVSDLIFGKPGGMMVSEALNMNVPFVAIEPIPGQEIYNAKFINDNNFGIAVNDEKDFEKVLALLKNNPKVIIEWTKNVGENFLNFEFISEKEINKRFVAESVPKVR